MDTMQERQVLNLPPGEVGVPDKPRNSVAVKVSTFDAVRAFGVMAGPSALLDLFLFGSVIATACGALTRPHTRLARQLRPLVGLGTALAVAYPTVIRPWMLRWGATAAERRESLPGDALVPDPATTSTLAITVDAPVIAVWPWLAQIGQDRAGFYSYEWLENLAGCRMRNADHIYPEWQHRHIGEVVKLHWAYGYPVAAFEPGRALVLAGCNWAFVVEPLDEGHTRVLVRGRKARGWDAAYDVLLIELPHFLMERKMLIGLKRRAERAWRGEGGATRIEREIVINRPVDQVFDFIADGRNEPRYNAHMLRAEQISPGPLGRGAQFRTEVNTMGRTMEMAYEFTAYERPRRLEACLLKPLPILNLQRSIETFDPLPGGSTRMRWSWAVEPRGAFKLIGPLVVREMGRRLDMVLANAKRFLEAQL
ncbi:MAG: SRPBCC family protein [Ktedonobacterales bacterium]